MFTRFFSVLLLVAALAGSVAIVSSCVKVAGNNASDNQAQIQANTGNTSVEINK